MLLAFLVLSDPVGLMSRLFRVSHMVRVNNGFLSANQVTRNGTLMGLAGGGTAHDGIYQEPLLVLRGKLKKVDLHKTYLECGQTELLGKIGDSSFVFQVTEPSRSGLYRAYIMGGRVRNVKRTDKMPFKSLWANQESSEMFDPRSEPSFGFQDVAENGTTSWYKIPHGFQIGSHECKAGSAMGTLYGIGLKLQNGKRVPFQDQLERLNGMESRRLIYVSPDGWFVVMMDTPRDDRYLVWIEPN